MSNVIRVSADGVGDELRSFQEWLWNEPDVRRYAVISVEAAETGEGEMGGALDVVKLVIDTNFQILNFGLAYVAWRATRPRPTPVTVERDGVRITLDESDPEAVARLVRALDE
ncbi:effector-associated constant component EACC1 [Streptomyces sp. 2A115]|uniref:effector-associated constant component EACC1 n=1 Tax=Streptomyces sp. 2A115 TaxID=3457439 RepID=UPI003FD4B9C3